MKTKQIPNVITIALFGALAFTAHFAHAACAKGFLTGKWNPPPVMKTQGAAVLQAQ
jgi:hypothetical protein